ncbi:MAG: penicillin-binding protein 2 [Rhodospirillales bacterium]|nr:penicillin-binding protein 2 [Rhodospirillales bacterium]MCB9996644.1 penicillin-binding protein 2 [Rhodospirillales bacterium]
MKKDNDRIESFTRRAFIVGALQCTFLTVLGGRLAWLQVAQGSKYKTLAENNRINLKMIAPSRGKIVDRFGTALAVNDQNFRVLIVPEQAHDMEKVLSSLQKLIDLSQRDIKKVLKQVEKQAAFVPLEVKDNLNWEDVARIEVHLPDLPGVSIDVGEIRTYPYGAATAHLVGYVGAVSRSELSDDPVLSLPGFKIGKTGIEKVYDEKLRGTAGTAEVEVNVVGREVRELKRHSGKTGAKVKLSIDTDLQIYTQERLATEQSASAVIMDVHTGAVYALSSSPSFDPNLFTRGLSAEKWEEMLADPGLPLNNKAVGGQYPPGSTFKMVTALAALEEGKITRNKSVYCPGHYDYGDDRFHCWKRGGHGRVDLIDALAESCDTFFYEIATDIGIDKLAEYAYKLGLGQKLAFELAEERPGLMPSKGWKMGQFGESWQPGETIVASIGQGYILSTPLQLAVMTSRLVNGGFAVKPWVVGYTGRQAGQQGNWPKLGFQDRHLELIIKGMNRVVGHPDGTAFASQIDHEAFKMGGKTGTAQVKRITMADRLEGVQNSDLPWKYRHHALFVGYAPVSSPRYACAVVVEHGGSGSGTAAPIARDILRKTQERDPASKPMSADGMEQADGTPPVRKAQHEGRANG